MIANFRQPEGENQRTNLSAYLSQPLHLKRGRSFRGDQSGRRSHPEINVNQRSRTRTPSIRSIDAGQTRTVRLRPSPHRHLRSRTPDHNNLQPPRPPRVSPSSPHSALPSLPNMNISLDSVHPSAALASQLDAEVEARESPKTDPAALLLTRYRMPFGETSPRRRARRRVGKDKNPPFDFQKFLLAVVDQMKSKSAEPVAHYL